MDIQQTYYRKIINLPGVLDKTLLVSMMVSLVLLVTLPFFNFAIFTAITLGVNFVVSGFLYWLNHRGHALWAAAGLFIITSSVVTSNAFMINGIYGTPILAYPVIIVFGSMFFGRKWVPLITVTVISHLGFVYALTLMGYVHPFEGQVSTNAQDFYTNVILLAIAGVMLWLIMNVIESNVTRILDSEQKMQASYEKMLQGWSHALELRDQEIQGHSNRVTALTLALAGQAGYPQEKLKFIRWGALLHDIGKMGVPDDILQKADKLTPAEIQIIRAHPEIAVDLLEGIPYLTPAINIPRYHHERWNGSGYPNGLRGKQIPEEARLFAIVDVYDALTSYRPYNEIWSHPEALDYLKENSGIEFDPEYVQLFLEMMGNL